MIVRIAKRLINVYKLKKRGIVVPYTVNASNTDFEGLNKISKNTVISNSEVGYMTYVGANSNLPNCIIGRFCSIGSNVNLIVGRHPTNTFVSTHPSFFSTRLQVPKTFVDENKFQEFNYIEVENKKEKLCLIGNDVWIGSHVKIIDGIKIGDGAIIAAGSLVLKDVPPYAVVGGVPSRIIKYRFKKNEIEYLKWLNWWNKDIKWITDNSDLFEDIEELMKAHHVIRDNVNGENECLKIN